MRIRGRWEERETGCEWSDGESPVEIVRNSGSFDTCSETMPILFISIYHWKHLLYLSLSPSHIYSHSLTNYLSLFHTFQKLG